MKLAVVIDYIVKGKERPKMEKEVGCFSFPFKLVYAVPSTSGSKSITVLIIIFKGQMQIHNRHSDQWQETWLLRIRG